MADHPRPSKTRAIEVTSRFWKAAGVQRSADMVLLRANPWLVSTRAPKSNASFVGGDCFMKAALRLANHHMLDFGLQAGAPLNDPDEAGQTVLFSLLDSSPNLWGEQPERRWAYFESLIAHGARCDSVTNDGRPLWMADGGRLPTTVFQRLLDAGAPIEAFAEDGTPYLSILIGRAGTFAADSQGNIAAAVALGKHVKQFDLAPELVDRPLGAALSRGLFELAVELIAAGADLAAKDKFGRTYLHYAENASVAKWLLARGLALESIDRGGATPLARAAQRLLSNVDASSTCAELIRAGASLSAGTCTDSQVTLGAQFASLEQIHPGLASMLRASIALTAAQALITAPSRSPSTYRG